MAYRSHWQIEVSNAQLNKYRVVRGASQAEVQRKAAALQAQWNQQLARQKEAERKRTEREEARALKEKSIQNAEALTQKAEKKQDKLDNILVSSLDVKPFDYQALRHYEPFGEECPERPPKPIYPAEPKPDDAKYNPKPSLLVRMSQKKTEQFAKKNQKLYEDDHASWVERMALLKETADHDFEEYCKTFHAWRDRKAAFEAEQKADNDQVDQWRKDIFSGKRDAVVRFFSMVLEKQRLPFEYETSFDVDYSEELRQLIIDQTLPTVSDIPTLKKVTYIQSRKEYKETHLTDSQVRKKYESVIYQIVLKTINTCFSLEEGKAVLDSIALNGWINTIDGSTGKSINPCILSVTTTRKDFEELVLQSIDPKQWFKGSRGVSAASLSTVTPVRPIVQMDKKDHRFTEAHEVADELDDSVNLAAIDWQDFEHLVREIFEKEFSANGGEVKVTQASRDGGVDAVAFDPDPIRGGKIVIQAKRYTNTVGVSAVRDLYGTVLNEGANKGILVTTSNYGNDAYEFAKDKPLTLMNGANLLYLLEKHGYHAKIDLAEAKKMMSGS